MISAINVSKEVHTNGQALEILKKVSLSINSGESIALVGASGAGKSSLMTLLAGLDLPTQGTISLLGHNLNTLSDDERAALRSEHIGFVFQQFLLVPSLTALENILLPCTIRGEKEDTDRAIELLNAVGLLGREHHLPSQLSGGEQQRVAIARAFMVRPSILFADEPTGNLDQGTAQKVIDLLFELNINHKTTLVLVTHDDKLAARCEKVFHLNAGQLLGSKA